MDKKPYFRVKLPKLEKRKNYNNLKFIIFCTWTWNFMEALK